MTRSKLISQQTTTSISNLKEVLMTEPNAMPILKPEIIAPPSVSNLSVAQVGTGMFSVAMQVIMVVRFPNDALAEMQTVINADPAVPQTPVTVSTTMQAELKYGNGALPNAFDGEAEGFQAFVHVHGYAPSTRDVLIQWAANSQGGA
jgi:hypothetical protein